MPNQPGRIQILGHMGPESVDLIDLEFHCSGLQLDRYQALLRTFLPEEQVTEFSGQLRADCRMHSDQDRNLKINGLIEIAKPRFAGELFAGMNLASERWHLRPNIQARLDSDWKIDDADASQFEADLGFLQVQGQRGTGSELVFAFEADLNEIAEQRASNAADLPIDIGKVKGEVAMSDGVVEILVNSAEVSHGQLQCNARIEPFAEAEIPIHLAMNLTGGEATVRNIGLLKYLVPFMAGSESAGLVNFKSALDFKVEVDGHFDPQRHTSLAAMLNVLEGKGSLNLRGGSFMPADELSRLFSLLGRREALELRDLVSEFTLNHGQIETSLLELNSKGRKFHMNGTTTLAGVIDYQIDASDLLRGHRDGDKILAYLGNSGLQARLTGTIDAPSLDMPSFSELLSKAAGNALEDKAGEGLDRLLRKLFKKKR